ncbi:MAG: glycosyltransferase, partial [Candidatus Rokuibacteriota bacterium]
LRAIYRIAALSSGRGPYDVAHAHFGPVASDFRFARRVWRAPLVASFHGYDFSSWPRRHGPDVYRDLFATVDAVTGLNAYTMRRVRELGCPPEKLYRMPMGLDPTEFPFRERALAIGEPVRLLTVGRMIEKKGMEFSIRAVAGLVRRHPDVRYEIVGDGPLRPAIEALISELDLERVVVLHGARDAAFVRDRMAAAHLFVLTSVTAASGDQEGQAVVLQEAQACGLPVVTTDHSGLPEAIDAGRSGFLVPERDVDALVDRLEHLVSHPDLWASMGRAGRAYVEARFDNRTLLRELEGLYTELVERQRADLPRWSTAVGVSACRAARSRSGK